MRERELSGQSEKVHLSWTNDGAELECCLLLDRLLCLDGWMDGWLPGCETTMMGKLLIRAHTVKSRTF